MFYFYRVKSPQLTNHTTVKIIQLHYFKNLGDTPKIYISNGRQQQSAMIDHSLTFPKRLPVSLKEQKKSNFLLNKTGGKTQNRPLFRFRDASMENAWVRVNERGLVEEGVGIIG